jgi:hypothetical protein
MRFASLVAASTAVIAMMGCPSGDKIPPDLDKTPSMQAPRVPPDFEVDDSVDAKHDKVDWKIMQPTQAGKASVTVDFGRNHQVAGSIGVYGSDGATAVEEAMVTQDEGEYTIEWDVAANAIYYLRVTADQGKGPYSVNFTVTKPEPVDPCAGVECGEDEECQGGRCVTFEPPDCDPKCARGMVCVSGVCERPCGGGCPRGELCNLRTNKCYKDPCYQKQCPAGERCVGGVCKPTTTAPVDKECKPACTGGATCNTKTGKCEGGSVATPPPVDECAGPLSGSIVQVIPQGAKTVLVINRGSKVCVKVGQSGKIAGVGPAFKITEVYEFRSKAVIEADDKTIGANRAVTINR